jgi:hypothetical protein
MRVRHERWITNFLPRLDTRQHFSQAIVEIETHPHLQGGFASLMSRVGVPKNLEPW